MGVQCINVANVGFCVAFLSYNVSKGPGSCGSWSGCSRGQVSAEPSTLLGALEGPVLSVWVAWCAWISPVPLSFMLFLPPSEIILCHCYFFNYMTICHGLIVFAVILSMPFINSSISQWPVMSPNYLSLPALPPDSQFPFRETSAAPCFILYWAFSLMDLGYALFLR